jgi:hypothetical protein
VNVDKLRDMIQKFELTIDIESLIEETDKDASGLVDCSVVWLCGPQHFFFSVDHQKVDPSNSVSTLSFCATFLVPPQLKHKP